MSFALYHILSVVFLVMGAPAGFNQSHTASGGCMLPTKQRFLGYNILQDKNIFETYKQVKIGKSVLQ